MKRILSLFIVVILCASAFMISANAALKFTDVKETDWFYSDVENAVELGLVNGKTETTYCPNDNLSYAEAIKLAACMYQLYVDGSITLKGGAGAEWYVPYVEYCEEKNIISKEYNYKDKATRAGYMEIFAKALPAEALKAVNTVADDAIPDVPSSKAYAAGVYTLYRAGIVQGSDAAHNCYPLNNIKRSEVAAILTRMMDPAKRISFTLGEEEPIEEPEKDPEPVVDNTPFLMYVADVIKIDGKGNVLTGKITFGNIKVNDKIYLLSPTDDTITEASVADIEMYKKSQESAEKGDNVGILLDESISSDIAKNTVAIVKGKEDYTHTNKVKGTLTVLTKEEGGSANAIKNGDSFDLYFEGSSKCSSIISGLENDVNPGNSAENAVLTSLTFRSPMYEGMQIALRVSGRSVAKFVVTSVEPYAITTRPSTNATVSREKFSMTIDDAITITGKGVVVTGKIATGTIIVGDSVVIKKKDGSDTIYATIAGIEMFKKTYESATKGDTVGLLLDSSVTKNMIASGDVITAAVDADTPRRPDTTATVVREQFSMTIDDAITITGKGVVVTGKIATGTIIVGDSVVIKKKDGSDTIYATIAGIEMFKKTYESATKGDTVGLLLDSSVTKNMIASGDVMEINLDSKTKSEASTSTEPVDALVKRRSFEMEITDALTITGKGVVVTGKIAEGTINIDDSVYIVKKDGSETISAKIVGIEMFKKTYESATKGDNVGLLLDSSVTKNMIASGDVVVKYISPRLDGVAFPPITKIR